MRVRLDSRDLNRKLNNAVSYSYGFLKGIDIEQIQFNIRLAEYTTEALYKYIDSNARMNPESLHHVYEWGQVGSESGRLYEITPKASKRVIHFTGKFLPSKSQSQDSSEPFVNKAYIMENAIGIEIEPRAGDFLVFEVDEGETVFTANAVYIEHPGGYAVEGSFGKVVEEFFGGYFTHAILKPFIQDLQTASEYTQSFAAGVRGGGMATGVNAGKNYLRTTGAVIS